MQLAQQLRGQRLVSDSPSAVTKSNNILVNGGMDNFPSFVAATDASNWINGQAAGSATDLGYRWKYFITAGGAGTASFDTGVSNTGAASLKLDVTVAAAGVNGMQINRGGAASPSTAVQIASFTPIRPGRMYTVRYFYKTSGITSVAAGGLRIIGARYNGTTTAAVGSSNSGAFITGTVDWTAGSFTFKAEATSIYLNVIFQIYGETGTAWVDGITVS